MSMRCSAAQPVLDGRASFSVVGSLPTLPSGLITERLFDVKLMIMAAASHPLASYGAPFGGLAHYEQLVLTDRSNPSEGRNIGVMSPNTGHLADLFAKHAFRTCGVGFGGMPAHTVAKDLADGRLVGLSTEEAPPGGDVRNLSGGRA
jgi:DNA-binding transcriptional LysR family regulator